MMRPAYPGDPKLMLPRTLARSLTASAWIALAAASPVVLTAGRADAQAKADATDKHRIVIYTEGGRGKEVRDHIASALPEGVEEVDAAEFKRALAKRGQRTPFGLVMTLESKRRAMLGRIGKAADDVDADAVIIGYVRRKRSGVQEVLVIVVERSKDTPSIDQGVDLGTKTSKDDVATALGDLVEAWKPAPEPTTEPGGAVGEGTGGDGDGEGDGSEEGEDKEPEDGDAWVRPENVYGHEIFHINASLDIGGRFFSYNDGITTNLRDYDVFGSPGISLRGEVFPLAPLGIVVLKDLGLAGEFRIQPGISSETSDGTEVSTQWMRFGGGLRYRLPLGPKEKPFVLGLKGSFIQDGFVLEAEGALAEEAPSVKYNFMRVGLDGRFPIGPIALTVFGGYLGALDSGDVHERFRDSSIGGIDVGGGLTVPIIYGLEARLQAEYTRWFYAFAPIPGDAYVAGGALDEYLHLEIGPQYVF